MRAVWSEWRTARTPKVCHGPGQSRTGAAPAGCTRRIIAGDRYLFCRALGQDWYYCEDCGIARAQKKGGAS